MSGEVEKLKVLATNKRLNSWEREKATQTLADIDSKEAALALLDIANDDGLHSWEREFALSKAREIIKSKAAS